MLTHKQIVNASEKTATKFPGKKALYFGSYADWKATEESYLDVLVELPKDAGISYLDVIQARSGGGIAHKHGRGRTPMNGTGEKASDNKNQVPTKIAVKKLYYQVSIEGCTQGYLSNLSPYIARTIYHRG